MRSVADRLDIMDDMLSRAAARGLLHLAAKDAAFDGGDVTLAGRRLAFHGSCSYLGLERDARLKAGVLDALNRYGTQFSSSRAYVSAPLYEELEDLLVRIFERPVLVTPTTTLAHIAALPALVGERDAIVLDQQVHHSIQTATHLARVQGTSVEVIGHSRLDELEAKIRALRVSHRRIWYLADGIYSMFGDPAPVDGIRALLDAYECLHVYIDDAHGMSWTGASGRGYAADHLDHPRVVLAVSLNKAFAAAGGALVFPDTEWRRRVRTVGGPLIFSGPIQPPMLGAAVASARIHLSRDIANLQEALAKRIAACQQALAVTGLAVAANSRAPIRFVEVGLPTIACDVAERLVAAGYLTNIAIFPAVPMRKAGVRFTVTLRHDEAAYRRLIEALVQALHDARGDEAGRATGKAWQIAPAIGRDPSGAVPAGPSAGEGGPCGGASAALELTVRPAVPSGDGLVLETAPSIAAIDGACWDRLMGDRGSYSAAGLEVLERVFRGRKRPEDNWEFHYFMVRDRDGEPVLATFLTTALWKDDMLVPAEVSRAVEARRSKDPYFLTTRAIAMGSLLTEGDHLYLDRRRDWRGALALVLEAVEAARAQASANLVVLRDLADDDPERDEFLREQGFVRFEMPESMVIEMQWQDEAGFLATLSHNARRQQRIKVLPYNDCYRLGIFRKGDRLPSEAQFAHMETLYRNVKERNLGLNTFGLPSGLFREMLRDDCWELLVLYPVDPLDPREADLPAAAGAVFVGPTQYVPVVLGLDYRYVAERGLYRQCLRHAVIRATALGKRRICLGMGAPIEKARFGARVERRFAWFQAQDHRQAAVLEQLWADAARARA